MARERTRRFFALFSLGVTTLVGPGGATTRAEDVVINEFTAVNEVTLLDSDRDASDWTEIHNPGPAGVQLGGWHLTDDTSLLTKLILPDLTLPADSYFVVFASGKDRATAEGGETFKERTSSTFVHKLEFDVDGVLPPDEGLLSPPAFPPPGLTGGRRSSSSIAEG